MSKNAFAERSTADSFCPCCATGFPVFLDWSPEYRNVVCPNCNSHPRHRVFWLSVQQSGLLRGRDLKLLHFAPEGIIRRLVCSFSNITYITADREQGDVDVWLDVTKLPCLDQCVDVVLCSHVLTVVPEDQVALRELFRILRPGGWAWLQVSLNDEIATTLEDPALASPQERKRLFRDEHNIRLYGRDFADRVRSAGFTFVEEDFTRKNLSPAEAARYGLDPRETLYFGTR